MLPGQPTWTTEWGRTEILKIMVASTPPRQHASAAANDAPFAPMPLRPTPPA